METKAVELAVEGLGGTCGLNDERSRLQELTGRIYWAIPEMFERRFEPGGVEIHYSHGGTQRIYAWELAEGIARILLGLEIEKYSGDSWEDAQRRTGVIR